MTRPSDGKIFEFLSACDRHVGDLVFGLREMLLEEAPEAVEMAYRHHPAAVWYGFGSRMSDMVLYIGAAKSHVNLGFCRGASLPDPNRSFEGEGKVMRHIKFRSRSDLERPFVRRYIRAAMEQFRSVIRGQ